MTVGSSWEDGQGGGFFHLSEAPKPVPSSKPLHPASARVQKVHEGGAFSVVWQVGAAAFLKMKRAISPHATREHTTLAYLHRRKPLPGFDIPTAHFHAELGDQYWVVVSRVPGQTLAVLWPAMDETARQGCVGRVAAICQSLTAWGGDRISGVDGRQLSDFYMAKSETNDCSTQDLLRNCQELGMDCSSFVFYHCDLGPENVLVGPQGSVSIIDWGTAGFVPREWVRTKFRLSGDMDFNLDDDRARTEWRRRVSEQLQFLGFQDVASAWVTWRC